MEQVLENIKATAGAYKPEPKNERYESVRALLAAFEECRQYVKENARTDRGCAQRMSREIDEILSGLPIFRSLTGGTNVHQVHNRKLAEEYLDAIALHLTNILKEEQEEKKREIHQWVHKHPVLGELKKVTSKHLPKTAYILLFQQAEDGTLNLVTQESEDEKVYTRLRPHEFRNALKLHSTYHDNLPVVGAAVIADDELLLVIGTIPEPAEGKDQRQTLLALSSQAAGKPAKDFIDTNEVLKELHDLSRRRKTLKDAYILLFQRSEESPEAETPPEIVSRTASDGKVISRFWASDFAIRHKVFDTFRGKPNVVGAAVIKEKELAQVMGEVPQPGEDQTQLDVLLNLSRSAVEKPYLEFISGNEVLKGLHECANSEMAKKDPVVILFELTETGRIDVMSLPDNKGKPRKRIPLYEFQFAKSTHDRFAKNAIPVGASVLTRSKEKSHRDNRRPPSKPKDGAPQRHAPAPEERSIVLAAFGRTPLRTSLIATPENMRRLGVNL